MSTQVQERPDYLRDDEFFEQAESGLAEKFRRFDDTHLTRFAWMAGDDIPVGDRAGGRYWGLFPDEMIRKRRLMPIRRAHTLSINEYPALIGTAEVVNAPGYLAPIEMEGFERANSMRLVRAPRTIAYEIVGEYEDSAYGPALFEHPQLMGDDKKELILKLYRAIVPRSVFADPDPKVNRHFFGEGTLKPVTRKGVKYLGIVTGTFLDQWKRYLDGYAAENVRSANLSRHSPRAAAGTDAPLSEHELALYMVERMQEACARAWTHQTQYLETSRMQILGKRNGGTGKAWYDARDERYLIETGTVPLNLEEVQAASQMQERTEATMMRGFEKIVERMNPPVSADEIASLVQRQVHAQVGDVFDNLSVEQIEAILAKKRAAQETMEIPIVDPEARTAENRQARRQQAAQPAVVVGETAETPEEAEDGVIEPLDVEEEDGAE